MKKIFAAFCALCLVFTAQAQETSSKPMEDYNTFYIQYDAISLDELSLNGIGLGWNATGSISKSIPLFAEIGIRAQYAFGSENDVDYNMYSVAIPLSIGYHYQVSDAFALAPYAGLNVRYYLGGKADAGDYDFKLFDSDEADWKAFAFGWQIGVKGVFNKFSLGISYGTDFTEMVEDADKIGSLQITLGFKI